MDSIRKIYEDHWELKVQNIVKMAIYNGLAPGREEPTHPADAQPDEVNSLNKACERLYYTEIEFVVKTNHLLTETVYCVWKISQSKTTPTEDGSDHAENGGLHGSSPVESSDPSEEPPAYQEATG